MESFGDQEHISRNKERYALLEEKTKELGYKVGDGAQPGAPGLGTLAGQAVGAFDHPAGDRAGRRERGLQPHLPLSR